MYRGKHSKPAELQRDYRKLSRVVAALLTLPLCVSLVIFDAFAADVQGKEAAESGKLETTRSISADVEEAENPDGGRLAAEDSVSRGEQLSVESTDSPNFSDATLPLADVHPDDDDGDAVAQENPAGQTDGSGVSSADQQSAAVQNQAHHEGEDGEPLAQAERLAEESAILPPTGSTFFSAPPSWKPLECAHGYVVTENGRFIYDKSTSPEVITERIAPNAMRVDALGINPSGLEAYVIVEQATTFAIYRYTGAKGWIPWVTNLRKRDYLQRFSLGLVDLVTQDYYFGGYDTSSHTFRFWKMNHQTKAIVRGGSFRPDAELVNAARAGRVVDGDLAMADASELRLFVGVSAGAAANTAGSSQRALDFIYTIRVSDLFGGPTTNTPHNRVLSTNSLNADQQAITGVGHYSKTASYPGGAGNGYRKNHRVAVTQDSVGPVGARGTVASGNTISDAGYCGDRLLVGHFQQKFFILTETIDSVMLPQSKSTLAPFGFRFKIFPTSLDQNRPLPLDYVNRYTFDFADCGNVSCTEGGDYDPRRGIASVKLPELPITPETSQGAHYCISYYDYDPKNAYKKRPQIGPFENGLKADYCRMLDNKAREKGVFYFDDSRFLRPKLADLYFSLVDKENFHAVLEGSEWRLEGRNIVTYDTSASTVNVAVQDCVAENDEACGNERLKDYSHAKSAFRLYHLQPGTYTLTQTKAPKDYIPLNEPITFTIDADDANYSYGEVHRLFRLGLLVNHYKISTIRGRVALYEEDGHTPVENASKAGIQWSFLTEGNAPLADITPAVAGKPQESTQILSGHDGSFGEGWKLTHPTVEHAQRIVMKTSAPPTHGYEAFMYSCYNKNRASVGSGYIRDNQTFSLTVPRNTQVDCTLSYRKTSGTLTWEKRNSAGTPLQGSTWRIEALDSPAPSGFPLTVTDCVATEERIGNCIHNVNRDRDHRAGYLKVSGLPYGRYRLIETSAPNGYQLSPTYAKGGPPQTRTLTSQQPHATFGEIVNRTDDENGKVRVQVTVQVENTPTSDFTPSSATYNVQMEAASTGAPATFMYSSDITNTSRSMRRRISIGRAESNTIRLDTKNDRVNLTTRVDIPQAPPLDLQSVSCVSDKADAGASPTVYLRGNAHTLGIKPPTSFTIDNLPHDESLVCTVTYRPAAITSTIAGAVRVVDDDGRTISQAGKDVEFTVSVDPAENSARFNPTGQAQRSQTQRSVVGGSFPHNWMLYHLNPNAQPRLSFAQSAPEEAGLVFTSLVCRDGQTNAEIYHSTEAALPGESAAIGANTRVSCEVTYKRQTFGTLMWSKVDADDINRTLSGSKWRIKPIGASVMASEGIAIDDCVGADVSACGSRRDRDHRPGYFSVPNVPIGTYDLIEELAPVGYALGPKKNVVLTESTHSLNIGPLTNTSTLPEITLTAEILEIDADGRPKETNKHAGYVVNVKATAGAQHISPGVLDQPLLGKPGISNDNGTVDTSWKIRLMEGGSSADLAIDSVVSPYATGYRRAFAQCQRDTSPTTFDIIGRAYADGELALTDVPVGSQIYCVLVYAPSGYQLPVDLRWRKTNVDGDALSGSEWMLEKDGQQLPVTDCAAVDTCEGTNDIDPTPGVLRVPRLTPGEYTLRETKAPLGYAVDAPRQVQVEPQREFTDLGDITNMVIIPPSLPLTGGMSSDALMFSGAGFLSLAGAGWVLSTRRGKHSTPRP